MLKDRAIEYVEVCPYCGYENIYDDYDVENGYVMNCRGCGKRIFLCDACSHADDNYRSGFCDWHVARKNVKGEVGKCFRGVTINRI